MRKLVGLLIGCGCCILLTGLFVWAFLLQEGVTINALGRYCLAAAALGVPTFGFLSYRLDRDIRHSKDHG